MKARVAIQIGVSPQEWRLLKKAAKQLGLPLAAYVRECAIRWTERMVLCKNADGHFTDQPAAIAR